MATVLKSFAISGIDGYAHTVSLHNNNYTIAVVGTGVDICYPKEHLTLMNRIIENGAIISEFEPGVSNVKSNFIKRNELIAMLSEKIIIVEATKNSGSLYTAHYGVKYGKKFILFLEILIANIVKELIC